ncbi:MAG: hypothetical protein H7641_06480 [Candidatus Heimdallarchaeota archaeon]|nr:hypothetical protein [Candidatus Heimdallarchaeota archaeon]MCK4877208.1 hypothetical protein [Candidatus Heimdallarchaeota archaeon]
MVHISTEEKYHKLEISPFHVPFLRDLGIKVISIIMFDIIYGPVCFLKELSRSNFGDKLKDVSSLSEIYTGFARTNADVITSLDERIVLGRFTTFQEEVENIVVLLFVCVPTADLDKLTKYARSLSERTQGDPKIFDEALKHLIDSEKVESVKIPYSARVGNVTKGLSIDDNSVITGTEFNNFYGFIFIQYHKGTIDGRFFPKIIAEKKMDLSHLFKFIDIQKSEAELKEGDLISLYYKGLELLVYKHKEKEAIMIGAKKPHSKINYSYIDDWFTYLFNSYINVAGETKTISTQEAILYMDKNISRQPKKHIISEIVDLIIHAEEDHPELSERPENIQQKGWITLERNFQLFSENLSLFKGNHSIYAISQNLSVPVSLVVEFVIFLKSRKLVDVYRK